MKRVAIYARVSTKRYQDVDTQLIPLREYAGQRGWEIQSEYVDVGVSGSRTRRPALDQLMSAANRRAFDVVLVFRFDRFARSTMHLATALAEFHGMVSISSVTTKQSTPRHPWAKWPSTFWLR